MSAIIIFVVLPIIWLAIAGIMKWDIKRIEKKYEPKYKVSRKIRKELDKKLGFDEAEIYN